MSLVVSKQFHFCACHRLLDYKGKCANLHGHNYIAEIKFSGRTNATGIVLDFSRIRQVINTWLSDKWDHATLVNMHDKDLLSFIKYAKSKSYTFNGNATAENMTLELTKKIQDTRRLFVNESTGQDTGVRLLSVTIYETPTSSATNVVLDVEEVLKGD